MTSEQIEAMRVSESGPQMQQLFWLREIALQLALFNEHQRETDATVFGTRKDRQL